jgi:hypothetical protein
MEEMSMESNILDRVSRQVFSQFPEVKGCTPKVRNQAGGQYLLIYEGKGKTADGKMITRVVRVVVHADGTIGKITTSR